MFLAMPLMIINLLILVSIIGLFVYLVILCIKALKKYLNFSNGRSKKSEIKKSLGETLRDNRIRCNMTQEFVAESLGVSRQAVSKWENGTSDPSTINLIALTNLYDISANELLDKINK